MNTILFLFRNTREVLLAERAAKKLLIPCRIIPVPRSISSECTMAIECSDEFCEGMEHHLKELGILHDKFVMSGNSKVNK